MNQYGMNAVVMVEHMPPIQEKETGSYLEEELSRLRSENTQLKEENNGLRKYAYKAAHDLKSPCDMLNMLAVFIAESYQDKLNNEDKELLSMMTSKTERMSTFIRDILEQTCSQQSVEAAKTGIVIGELIHELKTLLHIPPQFRFNYSGNVKLMNSCKTAVLQILLNLCNNAIKYNDKENGELYVGISEYETGYVLMVADNGPGMPDEDLSRFLGTIDTCVTKTDKGTGIGLSTVKDLVKKLSGDIRVHSEKDKGCIFEVEISK